MVIYKIATLRYRYVRNDDMEIATLRYRFVRNDDMEIATLRIRFVRNDIRLRSTPIGVVGEKIPAVENRLPRGLLVF